MTDDRRTLAERRVPLPLDQVLRFNPRWNDQDREKVKQAIDQHQPDDDEGLTFYTTDSRQYVCAQILGAFPAIWIGKGYITKAVRDGSRIDEQLITYLSTHVEQGSRTIHPDEAGTVCPVCHTERSKTGECWCS